MKRYLPVLIAFLTAVLVTTSMLTVWPGAARGVSRPHTGVPVTVAVGVTPSRLLALDTATIATTFAAASPDKAPYSATLELQPQSGGPRPTLTQGGFHLYPHQPLTVYWEWRAGASLPSGTYSVWVHLHNAHGQTVTNFRASAPLLVAGPSQRGG
jgi:hypothetical protein